MPSSCPIVICCRAPYCHQVVLLKDYLPYLNKQKRKVKDLKALLDGNSTELQSVRRDTAVPSTLTGYKQYLWHINPKKVFQHGTQITHAYLFADPNSTKQHTRTRPVSIEMLQPGSDDIAAWRSIGGRVRTVC